MSAYHHIRAAQQRAESETLLRRLEAAQALLAEARDYLSGIPESAAGGDDAAVALTARINALLAPRRGHDR